MLQYVAGRSHERKDYIVLKDTVLFVYKKRVAACYSVLQCVAVCCNMLLVDCTEEKTKLFRSVRCSLSTRTVLQNVADCCSVLLRVAVCCSLLQCVAVCCSVTQFVASRSQGREDCCLKVHDALRPRDSVMQCVAV